MCLRNGGGAGAFAGGACKKLEKPSTTLAVGGKSLIYYLPLTIAERRLLVWRPAQGETEGWRITLPNIERMFSGRIYGSIFEQNRASVPYIDVQVSENHTP